MLRGLAPVRNIFKRNWNPSLVADRPQPLRPARHPITNMAALAAPAVEVNGTGVKTSSAGKGRREEFLDVYQVLRGQLLDDELIVGQPGFSRDYFGEMLDYNVPHGKLNRGTAVADAVEAIKGKAATKEDIFKADVAGWCVEWLQAFFLVADDIMDGSVTRRGQPCWFRQPHVGLVACNDYILLETCIYRILKINFGGTPQYIQLVDLMHDVTHQTAHGQMLDVKTAPIGTVDLTRYTLPTYLRIVTYKTAFYSFYLPVAYGMVLGGITNPKAYQLALDISVEMGQYFQIQDDYLDCFGDPKVIGKVGTDIQDNKCSWLIVQALLRASPEQKKILEENYGKDDEKAIAKVKALYRDLDLEGVFQKYEQESYEKLQKLIYSQNDLPPALFTSMLAKIYKRSK
eukprot:jgi/Botrbrau1/14088/Bobra.182_3s0034.1